MAKVRLSMKWLFGNVINSFKFSDFKKRKQKVGLSNFGKMYRVSALLANARTSLYRNNGIKQFNFEPLTNEEYFL